MDAIHKWVSSHTRTIVRECCKGDDESLWNRGKFDPPPPKNPLTDGHQHLCMWLRRGYLPLSKILSKSVKGFGSAHAWFRAPRHKVTGYFFGSSERLQPRCVHRFWCKIRQTTRLRARKCLLGVAKPISKVWTPIFPKKRHFWPPLQWDLEYFRPKTALTLDGSRVNDPLKMTQ